MGQFADDDHGSLLATRAARNIDAGKLAQEITRRFLWELGQGGIKSQQLAALRESMLFGSVGKKAEVTDAHEAFGKHVKEETADEFVGIEGDGLFSIPIFAISIAQGDLVVIDFENTVVGESHAMRVAAEVIEHGLWGAERLFRVDDPVLFT